MNLGERSQRRYGEVLTRVVLTHREERPKSTLLGRWQLEFAKRKWILNLEKVGAIRRFTHEKGGAGRCAATRSAGPFSSIAG